MQRAKLLAPVWMTSLCAGMFQDVRVGSAVRRERCEGRVCVPGLGLHARLHVRVSQM